MPAVSGSPLRPRAPRAGVLRLYPPAWRRRYEPEVLEILALRPINRSARLDLVRGALDAWLHPSRRSLVPAVAAITGGGVWTALGAYTIAQPVPLDWPGYAFDVLPLAMIAIAALLISVAGAWLKVGDATDAVDHLAVDLAIAGHVAWFAALGATIVGIDYGMSTVIASTAAAAGTIAVGACLLRAGHDRVGALLILTSVALLVAAPAAWLAFGLGWTAIGWLQLPRGEGLVSI